MATKGVEFLVDMVMFRGRMVKGLVPANGLSEREFEKYGIRDLVKLSITRPRRRKPSALYFAILHVISSQVDYNVDMLHQLVKAALGYSANFRRKNGQIVTVYGSVAFDKMDDAQFSEYLAKALDFLSAEVVPHIDKETLTDKGREILGKIPG